MLVIYTDGSAKNNGASDAIGGFGVIVCETNNHQIPTFFTVIDAYSEQVVGTTNNRMEISGLLWALKNYGVKEEEFFVPIVYTDSMYCINSFTNWIKSWKARGWIRPGNKPLENLDLIKEWDNLCNQGYKIDLRYIKGHNGHIWNEMADQLATGKITKEQVMEQYGNR